MYKLLLAVSLSFLLYSCQNNASYSEQKINRLIDNWHLAATNANLEKFFELMSSDATYIGTDATERWTRKEFYDFCKPHFDKGTAWDFKAYNRKIYTSPNGETIWFDELLKTWMGVCRGSGVISIENGNYKISHYHLSVTVQNERIEEFLEIEQNTDVR